ncbi:hypothetical protein PUN28_008798 [Cardiocondyla obscurior]|uniref:PWWP domain-containing protein n=1 Tax=Cardiocondyla obscurior TaxID=286306 RepID=A0AAW2FU04_9HYME
MRRFSIVEFEDGIQLIPTLWIFNENKKCYWPCYTKQEKINQAIFNEERPEDDKWKSYNVIRIFGTADTYSNSMRKLKLAEQISNIESGNDDTDKKMSRRKRAKKRFNYEEDDSENETTTEKEDSEEVENSVEVSTQKISKKNNNKIPPLNTLPTNKKKKDI